FDTRAELHERAERRDAGDFAFDDVAFLEGFDLFQPRVFGHLLKAETEAVFVDGNDLGFDGFADFYVIARVVDALPGNFRDVDQAFDAIDVDERAEVNYTSHNAFDDVADLQLGEPFLHIVLHSFLL